jgi:tetratricopeptide (TPR) repeat protein
MRAWFAGDYEHCLALCDLVERRLAPLALDVRLLRARVLLRLGRAGDALHAVERALGPVGLLDASLTARMLQGTALVRLGRIDEGLVILDAAQADAAAGGAHPTIRSEIALNRGLAHYGLRDLDAAENALRGVAGDADVIRATALSYEGWLAAARGDYPAAIERFVSSLRHLDTCRRYDRGLEANCLQTLSAFAVERLDRTLWQFVAARSERMKWGGVGLAEARFWITMASCYMEELEGCGPAAVRAGRIAEELAPSDAYRVQARLRRAAVSRLLGEYATQYDHADSARVLFERLQPEALSGDERNVALTLAEELAHVGAVDEARQALATYHSHPVSAMLSSKNDRRMQAYERLVEGHIAEAAGDRVEAHHAYRDAFQVFRATGYRRRALIAALRLAELADQPYLYDYVATELIEFSPESWFRRSAQGTATTSVPTPPRAASIAP